MKKFLFIYILVVVFGCDARQFGTAYVIDAKTRKPIREVLIERDTGEHGAGFYPIYKSDSAGRFDYYGYDKMVTLKLKKAGYNTVVRTSKGVSEGDTVFMKAE